MAHALFNFSLRWLHFELLNSTKKQEAWQLHHTLALGMSWKRPPWNSLNPHLCNLSEFSSLMFYGMYLLKANTKEHKI